MRGTIPSHHRANASATPQSNRLGALLGVLALALGLGHVHTAHEAPPYGSDATPVVSDDAAHQEHSAHATLNAVPCFACRSHGDESIASRTSRTVPLAPLCGVVLRDRTSGSPRAPFAGLPATRAPPISLLG